MGYCILCPRNRKTRRMPSGGDENVICLQPFLIDLHHVRVQKVAFSEGKMHTVFCEVLWFRIAASFDNPLCPRNCGGPIDGNLSHLDTKLAKAACQRQQFCDPDQGLFGNSPIVQSGASQLVPFHDRDLLAQPERRFRRSSSCRTAANNQKVK